MGGGTTIILGGLSINTANFDHTHQAYSSIMDQNIGGGGLQPQSPMGSAAYVDYLHFFSSDLASKGGIS